MAFHTSKDNPQPEGWTIELRGMPHFQKAMQRVYAWFEGKIIDRPPVRFLHKSPPQADPPERTSEEWKSLWFDAEYQVDSFLKKNAGKTFHGETFPVFYPNLGPDVYAAFYGCELTFGPHTSWSVPCVETWEDAQALIWDTENVYFQKMEKITNHALKRCRDHFLVGYTDLHPGLDCVAAWRGVEQLCWDLFEKPKLVGYLAKKAVDDFHRIYNHFDCILKAHNQPSATWLNVPSFGKLHVPSCDFSALISPESFARFGLPVLEREVRGMTHNVFHVDGKGVANHLEHILAVPKIDAIQWVPGAGSDRPIMQWIPFLKRIQARQMPIITDVALQELAGFTNVMSPEGLFLCVPTTNEEEELKVLRHLETWV
jgi:hypothetical protein